MNEEWNGNKNGVMIKELWGINGSFINDLKINETWKKWYPEMVFAPIMCEDTAICLS